jgi:hypothetical protein
LNVAGQVCRTKPNWNRRLKLKIPGTFRRQLARPRVKAAARYRLLAEVRPWADRSRRFRLAHEAKPDACFPARQQLLPAVRHRSSEQNQRQAGSIPESRHHLVNQAAWRLLHLNGAEVNLVHDHNLA